MRDDHGATPCRPETAGAPGVPPTSLSRMDLGFRMSDPIARLNEVFRDVFDDDDLSIDRGTTAEDVEGWDSMMHVTLLIGVEKAFGVKFTSSEVARLKSVGDLADLIEAKRGS